jgi:hypothetical protein
MNGKLHFRRELSCLHAMGSRIVYRNPEDSGDAYCQVGLSENCTYLFPSLIRHRESSTVLISRGNFIQSAPSLELWTIISLAKMCLPTPRLLS